MSGVGNLELCSCQSQATAVTPSDPREKQGHGRGR